MDLEERLKTIFKEENAERISGMMEALKGIRIYKEDDLVYLDEEILKEAKFFNIIEIKKLLSNIRGAKNLKETLKDIFGEINPVKFSKIESFYEEQEIYTAEHLTLKLSKQEYASRSDIFSDLDIKKIRNYIKKTNPETFEDIKSDESFERTMAEETRRQALKKQENDNEIQKENLISKMKERGTLINHKCNLQLKSADLSISNASQYLSQRQNFGLPALPAAGQGETGMVSYGALAIGGIGIALDVAAFIKKNSTYADDKKKLEEQIEEAKVNYERLDQEVQIGTGHALESHNKLTITDISDD